MLDITIYNPPDINRFRMNMRNDIMYYIGRQPTLSFYCSCLKVLCCKYWTVNFTGSQSFHKHCLWFLLAWKFWGLLQTLIKLCKLEMSYNSNLQKGQFCLSIKLSSILINILIILLWLSNICPRFREFLTFNNAQIF